MQSKEVLKAAGSSCDIGSVCVYGGVSKWPQKEAKKVGVRRNYKTIMILPQTPTAELQATFKSSKKQPGRRLEVMGNSQSEGEERLEVKHRSRRCCSYWIHDLPATLSP